MLNIPIRFEDLLKIVDQLSAEQKRILREQLTGNGAEEHDQEDTQPKGRILGLHPNAIWTSEDFDDPLPDEFWLGEDA